MGQLILICAIFVFLCISAVGSLIITYNWEMKKLKEKEEEILKVEE